MIADVSVISKQNCSGLTADRASRSTTKSRKLVSPSDCPEIVMATKGGWPRHVDCLKVDGHFVRNMAEDPIDRAMVVSINQIGHLMGMRTVGEFVESDEVRTALREVGVIFAQGHGIAQPIPFEDALQLAIKRARVSGENRPVAEFVR